MRLLRILVAVLLFTGLYSCSDPNTKIKGKNTGFSKLRIVVDPNANFYLDSIRISANYKFKVSNYREYDSSLSQDVYMFDSVENGKINLTLVSILNRNYDKNISLQSDTTIIIKENELNNFADAKAKTLTSLNLNDGDTVVVGLSSMGCFHFLKENIIITKTQGTYNVAFNTTRGSAHGLPPMHLNKTFDSSFIHTVDSFYKDCKALLKRRSICMSTTTAFIVVRIGNTVYCFPDIGCGDWQGYDNLVKAIDPPWTKKNAS